MDVSNQTRQRNLALEEFWVTGNGWFQIFTTFLGFTISEVWFLTDNTKDNRENKDDSLRRIVESASELSESLLDMAEEL